MAEKDSQSNSQNQNPERKFSQEQYNMLMHCSIKRDISDWNKWRVEHINEEILLEGADLLGANLRGANLWRANLKGAYLGGANLEGVFLQRAVLKGANLQGANLKGGDLWQAKLECASFYISAVDGSTLIHTGQFDRFTNFSGVGLNNARVPPGTKQLLEYNIRRLRW